MVSVYFPFKRINTQNGEGVAVPFHVRLRVNKQRRISVRRGVFIVDAQDCPCHVILEICFWFSRSLERDARDSL